MFRATLLFECVRLVRSSASSPPQSPRVHPSFDRPPTKPRRARAARMLRPCRCRQADPPESARAALDAAQRARSLVDRPGGIDTGEAFVRLVHAEALWAADRKKDAREAIAAAKTRLNERAARIRKEEWRETFL